MTEVVKWYGEKAKLAVRRGAARGLREWAELVFKEADAIVPVAPVKGGFLRDSGKVEVDEGALRAAISYDTPPGMHLAIWVHEIMGRRHSSGKEAKFLEKPLNASKTKGQILVSREIKKVLR